MAMKKSVAVLLAMVVVVFAMSVHDVNAARPIASPALAPESFGGPSYAPESAPSYAPEFAPSYTPEFAPSYAPEAAPSYAPEMTTPAYAPSSGPSVGPSPTYAPAPLSGA